MRRVLFPLCVVGEAPCVRAHRKIGSCRGGMALNLGGTRYSALGASNDLPAFSALGFGADDVLHRIPAFSQVGATSDPPDGQTP